VAEFNCGHIEHFKCFEDFAQASRKIYETNGYLKLQCTTCTKEISAQLLFGSSYIQKEKHFLPNHNHKYYSEFNLVINELEPKSWTEKIEPNRSILLTEQEILKSTLQYYRCSSLLEKVKLFREKLGTIEFFPMTAGEEENSPYVKYISKTDMVYPICHEGINRSQILYFVLRELKKVMGADTNTVFLPHGAESGFDPHTGYENLNEDNFIQYVHGVADNNHWVNKCFYEAFQEHKVPRFGDSKIDSTTLNPKNTIFSRKEWENLEKKIRTQMHIYFSEKYFKCARTYNHVFITFQRAVPIIIDRILEANKSYTLENVTIVALPHFDEISRAGELSQIAQCTNDGKKVTRDILNIQCHLNQYKKFANIFRPASCV